jgi:hypothetical protein
MKGKAADPACPKLAVKPIGVEDQHRGFNLRERKCPRVAKMTYLRRRCEVPVE